MAEAYIYDAVRTPRGKGKNTGSLHEITSLQLATQALKAIKDTQQPANTDKIDDVILGCVTPIGEQGSDIARIAVLERRLFRDDGGRAGQPLLRFGPGGAATSRRPRS